MSVTKPKINTMKELSEAIGISRPTLSRYFQDPTTVLPSTSEKIKQRLADVDYVYNFIATRQNRKTTGLIGVIIPHFSDLFFTSLLEAIERSARDFGYTIITQSSDGNPALEVEAVLKLRSMNADGAIIAPLGVDGSSDAFISASEDFPIVFADSKPSPPVPRSDFVGSDNAQSIGAMVDYLCRTNDAPVFLNMPRLNSNALEREEAYLAQMKKYDAEPKLIETDWASDTWQFEAYGFSVMDDHFTHQRYTSATILCANDRIAIGAIRAANKHDLFVQNQGSPNDLRIAGHDDHPLSQYMHPRITTIAQDIEAIGKDSARLLIERIRGERDDQPVHLLKSATLKMRESA